MDIWIDIKVHIILIATSLIYDVFVSRKKI